MTAVKTEDVPVVGFLAKMALMPLNQPANAVGPARGVLSGSQSLAATIDAVAEGDLGRATV